MARSKDDVKYGAAQAKLSEDESLRTAYKHGTPLEGGKIAESETVDLFSSARNIPRAAHQQHSGDDSPQAQASWPPEADEDKEGGRGMTVPKNKTPSIAPQL